jgi:hypothetical protein
MATDIVQGLFGITPESYQQQRDAAALQRAAAFGQMSPMESARTSIFYGANQLGNVAAGMLGAEDPQLIKIRQQQQVLSGLNINDPQAIAEAVKRASDMGNPQLALQLTALGDQALQRQDLSLERQDKLRQRQAAAQSLTRTQTARDLISRGLSITPENISGQSAESVPEVDEQGYPLRSTLPGYQPPELKLDYARIAPLLMQSPEGRAELAAIVASQKAMRPETVSIKEGETLYVVPTVAGQTYKPIVSGGQKPTPFTGNLGNAANLLYKTTDPVKIFKEYGQPGLDAVDAKASEMAKASRQVVTQTTVLPPQEKAESTEYGKFLVEQFKNVSEKATLAGKSLPAIDINLNILNKDFETGFGTESKAAGAKVLAALGVQGAEAFATDAQTFLANANSAVLQKQLEQKGPQTASDADRITSTGAQLGNTKEANRFILSVAKAQLQRDIDQRKFYTDWRTEKKTFDGAETAWFAGPGSKSLFDSPNLKKYAVSTSAASMIPGQGSAPAPAIPPAAIDLLKSGKGTDAQFDAIFGVGAAKRVKGGN